jgi:hypothetical protein
MCWSCSNILVCTAVTIVRVNEARVYELMYRFFTGIRVKDVQHGALQWEWAIAMYVLQWEKRWGVKKWHVLVSYYVFCCPVMGITTDLGNRNSTAGSENHINIRFLSPWSVTTPLKIKHGIEFGKMEAVANIYCHCVFHQGNHWTTWKLPQLWLRR